MKKLLFTLLSIATCVYCIAQQQFYSSNYSYIERWNQFDKWHNITLSNNFTTAENLGGYGLVRGTIGISSASVNTKVYWEIKINSFSYYANVGVSNTSESVDNVCGFDTSGWGWMGGTIASGYYHNNTLTTYGTNYTFGDILGFALDMGVGTLTIFKNNVSQGVIVTGLTGIIYPTVSTYGGNVFNYTAYFDSTTWHYSPPSGCMEIHR